MELEHLSACAKQVELLREKETVMAGYRVDVSPCPRDLRDRCRGVLRIFNDRASALSEKVGFRVIDDDAFVRNW